MIVNLYFDTKSYDEHSNDRLHNDVTIFVSISFIELKSIILNETSKMIHLG